MRKRPRFRKSGSFFFCRLLGTPYGAHSRPENRGETSFGQYEEGKSSVTVLSKCKTNVPNAMFQEIERDRCCPDFSMEIPQPILRFSRKILPLRKKSATQLPRRSVKPRRSRRGYKAPARSTGQVPIMKLWSCIIVAFAGASRFRQDIVLQYSHEDHLHL